MDTKVKIELESKEAFNSVKDLQKALKATKDEMVGLSAGSKEFKEAANRAGELKHQLDEINQSVRGASADFGDMVGNISKAGAGISGAFQAISGALNLMGVESEDVTKAIQKMQSVMALTQGLQAIDQGIKAFGKFTTAVSVGSSKIKKALITTGFGALAIVIGSLIANWDEFTKSIGLSEEQMKKFGEVAGGVMNVLTGSVKALTKSITKVITGDFKGAWEELKNGFDISKLYAEGVADTITKREEEELKKRLKANKEYVDNLESEYDRQRSKAEATITDETKRINELIRIERKRLELYTQGTQEYYNQIKVINQLIESLKNEKEVKDTFIQDAYAELEYNKALSAEYANSKTALEDLLYIQEQELLGLEEGSAAWYKVATQIEKTKNAITAFGQESNNIVPKVKNGAEEIGNAYVDALKVGQSAMSVLSSTLNSFASEQDNATKEGFEKQKKMQISSAVVNMLGGIVGAIASCWSPTNAWQTSPVQAAMAAINAASVLAAGSVQIASIQRQQFGSASTGAASASISNVARTMNTPVQMTQDIQGAETIGAIKDTKVYVTETDITNTQKKVDIAETESVF